MQVKFTFGSSLIIFGTVMTLWLRKIPIIIGFRLLSPSQIDILNWHSVYRMMCHENMQVKLESDSGRLMPFDLEKFQIIFIFHSFSWSQIDILEINENATFVFSISFQHGLVHQNVAFIRQLYMYFTYSIKRSFFVLIDCQYALFKSTCSKNKLSDSL